MAENGTLLAAEQTDLPTGPVSYTHLRAHETVLDIVCRLLLETKNHFVPRAKGGIGHQRVPNDLRRTTQNQL